MRRWAIAVVVMWAVCTVPAHAAFPGENGRIAYSDGLDIRTMNPDGGGDLQLTTDPAEDWNPEWSPDGKRIVFASRRDGLGLQVYVMNADGSGQTRLTDPPDRSYDPAWSPDGQRIVFVRNGDLWLMNADGSGQASLLSRPFDDGGPDWSPDGSRIAFGNGDIWTIGPDGTDLSQVPTETPPDAVLGPGEYKPEWSPDGKRIAYAAMYTDTEDVDRFYFATVRSDGTETAFLDPAWFFGPGWSPDGSRIAATDGINLFTIDPSGSGRIDLPPYGEDLDWQPLPADTPGHYIRPKSAPRVRVPLVSAYRECIDPNREHGPPLVAGACSPPAQPSANATLGSGGTGKSLGRVRLDVTGSPGGADDSDVRIGFALTNVMNLPSLSDYTGELRAGASVRLTDRASKVPSTTDFAFSFTVPCAATPDATLGGECRLQSSIDALIPAAVPEGTRAVWALDQIQVHDGGLDGEVETVGDNYLLAVQGLFVP